MYVDVYARISHRHACTHTSIVYAWHRCVMHPYLLTCAHAHTHTYIHTFILHAYCVCNVIYGNAGAHVHTYIYAYVHTHTYFVFLGTYVHLRVHVCHNNKVWFVGHVCYGNRIQNGTSSWNGLIGKRDRI
jgi:hypothetical protein